MLWVNTGVPMFKPAVHVDVIVIARYKFVFEAETVKQTLSPTHALMVAGPPCIAGILIDWISGFAKVVGVVAQSLMTNTMFS